MPEAIAGIVGVVSHQRRTVVSVENDDDPEAIGLAGFRPHLWRRWQEISAGCPCQPGSPLNHERDALDWFSHPKLIRVAALTQGDFLPRTDVA